MAHQHHIEALIDEAQASVRCGEFSDVRLENLRTSRVIVGTATEVQQQIRDDVVSGARVLSKGRWGFAARRGEGDLASLVLSAARLAETLPAESATNGFAPAEVLRTEVPEISGALEFDQAELTDLLQYARAELGVDSRVFGTCQNGLRAVVNSEGTRAVRMIRQSRLTLTAEIPNRDRQAAIPFRINAAGNDCMAIIAKLAAKLPEAKGLLMGLRTGSTTEQWRGPVVLGPGLAGFMVHEAFGHLCEADRVPIERISKFSLGARVGPDSLVVWDRSDIPNACRSSAD